MNVFDMNSEASNLRVAEEGTLANFTPRLIDIAAVSRARGSGTSATAMLNAMRLPAIALDRDGFAIDANSAANSVFDDNIKIRDRRLFVRDPDSRNLIKDAIDQLTGASHSNFLAVEPVIVPRMDKLPVLVRIWPFEGPDNPPTQKVRVHSA